VSRARWALAALALAGANPAPAANYLFYGPTFDSGSYEAAEAGKPGNTITVWNGGTWDAKTTADFAAFDAIVFGEVAASDYSYAAANAAVWSAAVTGRILIIGTDPDNHNKPELIDDGVDFAASGCGTGLYVNLGQSYATAAPSTPISFLSGFGTFAATGACADSIVVNGSMPAYLGWVSTLTGGPAVYLDTWSCSVHEFFNAIPPGFDWVAKQFDANLPYIVARNNTGKVVASMPGVLTVSLGQSFLVPVTATDPGCGGLTNVSATLTAESVGGQVLFLSGPVPVSIPSIASNTSGTFTWTCSATGLGQVNFSSTVTGTFPDTLTGTAFAAQTVLVQSPAALAGSVFGPAQVCAGVPYTMTLTVTNTGEADANGIAPAFFPGVSGSAPAVLTGPPPGGGLIRGGETRTYAWTFTSTQTGTAVFTLSVTGQDANAGWVVTSGPAASSPVTVVAPAQIAAALSVPPALPVGASFPVVLTVTNTGGLAVAALAPVGGPVSGGAGVGLVSGPGGPVPLAAGASVSFTWTYSVTGWGQVSFSATASGSDACHAVTASATAGPMLLGTPATIAGSLLTAQPDPACVGSVITVALSVTNTGDVPATTVSGAPGPQVTGPGLAALRTAPPLMAQLAGHSATVLTWTFTASGAGPVSFSVTVTANDARDTTPLTTGCLASNAITVQSSAALAVSVAGPSGTLLSGSWATVLVTVTNTGGSAATAVQATANPVTGPPASAFVIGPTSAGGLFFSLAPGSSTTFSWTYSVSGSGVAFPSLAVLAAGCGGFLPPVIQQWPLLVRRPAVLAIQSLSLLPAAIAGGGTAYATIVLANTGDVPLTVTAAGIAVTGAAWTGAAAIPVPIGIAPGGTTAYTWAVLTRTVCGTASVFVTARGTDNVSGLPLADALGSNSIGVSGAPVSLMLTASPASADMGTPVTLRASLMDSCGLPVANTPVTFTVLTGGGSVAALNVMTDASGAALTSWTLGPGPGANAARVTLAAAGLSADVSATGVNPLALPGQGQAGLSANVIDPQKGEVAIARYFPFNDEPVAVRIFTASGRIVRTLESSRPMGDGQWMAIWDGKTRDEFPVARGVYLVRITGGGGLNATLKIVIAPH